MKNEIEQQIFEKMKAKDFGESMCNETKLNVLKWTMQQLRKTDVGGSFSFEDMANFVVWIKDNFSDEIAGAFARRSDGHLYWDEQVEDLVKLWCDNYR